MKQLIFIMLFAFGLLSAQTTYYYDPATGGVTVQGNYTNVNLWSTNDSIPSFYAPMHNDTTKFNIYTKVFGWTGLDSNHVANVIPTNLIWANSKGEFFKSPMPYNKGNTTLSSTLLQTTFVITHGLGYTPTSVIVQPKSASAASGHYVSAISSTTFTITYLVNIGISSLTWDWIAYK